MNTSKLVALAALMTLSTTSMTSAQRIIEGTVRSGGEPVVGANVGVENTSRGAATDTSGYFLIEGISSGTYELVISSVGYRTERREVTIGVSDTVTVSILLEEAVIQGEEIVVTGTMRETYVKESPVKVSVVTDAHDP